MEIESATRRSLFLPRTHFQQLLDALQQAGFKCVGPQVRDGAIVYDTLNAASALPAGINDLQTPGNYRLDSADHSRWFAWANGPQALKPFLFAPQETLWKAEKSTAGTLIFREQLPVGEPVAFIGARACDLAALAILDAHFLKAPYPDAHYAKRRQHLFILAVHCTHPASTCFCASTGDGPVATTGYDIAAGELDDGFVMNAGSERGQQILATLNLRNASLEQIEQTQRETAHAAATQTRTLPSLPLNKILFANLEHPRWNAVAERCLACGNCTSVCPTCFCSSTTEAPEWEGNASKHVREWSSCFTQGHAYLHGFNVRPDIRTRYRQWLTHKLGSWIDQYGRSGCVGCGRCIAWCPVGIDITEEINAICKDATHA